MLIYTQNGDTAFNLDKVTGVYKELRDNKYVLTVSIMDLTYPIEVYSHTDESKCTHAMNWLVDKSRNTRSRMGIAYASNYLINLR